MTLKPLQLKADRVQRRATVQVPKRHDGERSFEQSQILERAIGRVRLHLQKIVLDRCLAEPAELRQKAVTLY